jgi:signal transduction histidine kinase
MIRKKIYKPLDYLIGMIRDYKNGKKIKKEFFYEDEVGEMIQEFISLQTQLDKKIEELNQHKNNLEQEVKKEVEKRIFQEEILLKQSRLALMGEMIDVIAHQWKQPLNTISLSTQLLKLDKNDINEKYILNFADNISIQVAHMIETLEEFRGFFRENKHPEVVCMEKVVKKVLVLLQDELMRNSIKIEMQIDEDFCIKGSFNEFEHLLITLLTNAKDIFKERNIKDKKIIIKTHAIDEFYYLEVIDNAGGIPEAIIDKIFELNFTTREKGTGVGLYLATQIAIKHNGVLEVENTENGAKFYFKVKSDN